MDEPLFSKYAGFKIMFIRFSQKNIFCVNKRIFISKNFLLHKIGHVGVYSAPLLLKNVYILKQINFFKVEIIKSILRINCKGLKKKSVF